MRREGQDVEPDIIGARVIPAQLPVADEGPLRTVE
jgi:hypothetical protein